MGRTIKVSGVLLAVILILGWSIRLIHGNTDLALYKIFEAKTKGYPIHKLLLIIPSEIEDRYPVEVLKSSGNSQLIRIHDSSSPISNNFFVLKKNSTEQFIKAYPWSIFNKKLQENIEHENHISYLINLDGFNQYLKDFEIRGKKNAVLTYFSFIADHDSTSFRMVSSTNDLRSILLRYKIGNPEIPTIQEYELIKPESFKFRNLEGLYYCWFINKGLVQFHFEFENDRLTQVKSTILGYLGNEYPTCC